MNPNVNGMRFFLLVIGLLAFVGCYGYFLIEIWGSDGVVPDLDKQLVYVASALGGILGTFFAVSLGVQRKDPKVDQSKLNLAPTVLGIRADSAAKASPAELIATLALWLYALVGLAAVITAFAKSVETPDAIKTIAATFGGYAIAVFGAAFGQPSGSPDPGPAPSDPK